MTVYEMKAELHLGQYLYEEVPAKIKLLSWQKRGLQFTASGLGKKIPTRYMANYKGRWRRVYCSVFNVASVMYILVGNQQIVVSDIMKGDK